MREPLLWVLGGEDGHTPVPVNDLPAWAEMFGGRQADGRERRQVALTELLCGGTVSTVFVGIDQSLARLIYPDLPPLLFETMAWLPDGTRDQDRYATWAEAEAGHAAMVAKYARRTLASDK